MHLLCFHKLNSITTRYHVSMFTDVPFIQLACQFLELNHNLFWIAASVAFYVNEAVRKTHESIMLKLIVMMKYKLSP